ncbi:hypothetical protein L1987_31489 [Smallanthus sonchifolius]|uniref:Uncharacterized protein n=1 Tax=Smallanthus sonchifolius TaxID=185202 RepID=A0ACB9I6N0_9ASTR|nr:hypothetical protein L1987_31489 [Smallanthus sonchifolius]
MHRPARENPSFSSSLLDEIYRSIDERIDHEPIGYSKEKQSAYFQNNRDVQRQGSSSIGRDCLIENWIGKEVRSAVEFKRSSHRSVNSSSSSSDSSSGGGFSSSEAESVYCVSSRPKPIRTGMNRHDEYNTRAKQMNMYGQRYQFDDLQLKQKHEGKFVKTKSRAMKIYGDLKKVKQPISPGGRLATFLNSLFTTGNAKNTKHSSASAGSYDDGRSHVDRESKSASGSTCSSAASFSRSCLSKTPSSRGKLSNNKKRSVRFYPVSVIVGDDCQPCGHKSLYGDESSLHPLKFVKNPNNDEFRVHSNEKTRRIEEAARNLLRNYQKKVECEFDLITNNSKVQNEIDLNYEDDDDVASNASSDLFELENFSAIGMEDELPVYETTHLDTNLAIGNGFHV